MLKLEHLIVLALGALLFCGAQAEASYRSKAMEATDFIQRAFFDEQAKLYRQRVPPQEKDLPYDFMWPNGIQFTTLVAATKHEPERYRATMYAFARAMERYWDNNVPVPGFDAYFSSDGGNDKYYDDNVWLALGFIEAYETTKDPFFLDWARRTQKFVLSGWDDKLDGGVYWHQDRRESKNAVSNAPTAVAALELYLIGGDKSDLEWAQRIYQWTVTKLQDKDGLLWDHIKTNGEVERMKWTYNSALMIRANIGLWRALKDEKYLKEARRLADASLQRWVNAHTGAFADAASFNHFLAESLLMVYEETKDIRYLNAVRRSADFGYRYVRDTQNGGYWNEWKVKNHANNESKMMIENAAAARLFWLLVPYLDVEELQARGAAAARAGDLKTAVSYFEQAIASTAGALPTAAPQ